MSMGNDGKNQSHTKAGPGRMPHNRSSNPPGTKLIKRFIKDSRGEAHEYRAMLKRIQPNHALVAHLKD